MGHVLLLFNVNKQTNKSWCTSGHLEKEKLFLSLKSEGLGNTVHLWLPPSSQSDSVKHIEENLEYMVATELFKYERKAGENARWRLVLQQTIWKAWSPSLPVPTACEQTSSPGRI